ncbi:hypothetical protein QEO94_10920 [Kingella negevensis]|uniref:hypothetical protein n=1 Tax=Kingella negevensis TaxID=1522312 RepID=UPI0025431B11|nr:hypothetical protein [Kingella negevensis]WII93115.1 hypothetical protein QEO94_10920 [Kingella negevensis]
MKKALFVLLTASALFANAADKEPQIQSNSSSVTDNAFINSIAAASIGMGAKEPLAISETQANGKQTLIVSGSNGITCRIPVANNHMTGISCK